MIQENMETIQERMEFKMEEKHCREMERLDRERIEAY
jgi:hypothetical protein